MKPKTNRAGDPHKPAKFDSCQTPPYALEPLLPYLPKAWKIWECAAGDNFMVNGLIAKGYAVIGTDILSGYDFFKTKPPYGVNAIVTNPPYSVKYPWIKRCYELNLPWALLLPLETLGAGTAQKMFKKYGVKLILMDRRVDFGMPEKGWNGKGAQFPTAWFCWKLPGLIDDLTYAHLVKHDMRQVIMF